MSWNPFHRKPPELRRLTCAQECIALAELRAELKAMRDDQLSTRQDYHLVREELRAYHQIVMQALGLEDRKP